MVRGEGRADTFYGAFEAAVHKLESRLRRGKDRQKVHYGDKTPESVRQPVGKTLASAPLDLGEAFNPTGSAPVQAPVTARGRAQVLAEVQPWAPPLAQV